MCAFAAAVASTISINPLDVVKVRLYSQPMRPDGRGSLYDGSLHCLRKVVATEGVLALWKGVSAAFLRIGPHTVLTFTFIGAMRRAEKRWSRERVVQ